MMLQLRKLMHKTIITLAGFAVLACSSLTFAGETHDKNAHENLLKTARAKSEKCVDDTAFMRSNHMAMILHQRDDTLRKGIRGESFSLKECISCHIPENTNVRYGDDNHFCSSCHNYAAVTIDCFQCHTDRPTKESKTGYKASLTHSENPHYVDNSESEQGASNE